MKRKLPTIRGLRFNAESMRYQITEAGTTYRMPYELANSLKIYVRDGGKTVAAWYETLRGIEREAVERIGEVKDGERDFWPD